MADTSVSPPTISAEPIAIISATLTNLVVGQTPIGFRLEVPFTGTATSPHFEDDAEWTVTGVDHVIVGSDQIAQLDVHAVLSNGTDSIMYHATGRADGSGVREVMTFSTAVEKYASLNGITAVGRGKIDGTQLTIEVFRIDY